MTDPNQSATEPSEGKTPHVQDWSVLKLFMQKPTVEQAQKDRDEARDVMAKAVLDIAELRTQIRTLERENQSLRQAAVAARDLLAFIQDADVKACAAMVQMGIPLEPESYEIQNRITPALAELRARLEPTPEVP